MLVQTFAGHEAIRGHGSVRVTLLWSPAVGAEPLSIVEARRNAARGVEQLSFDVMPALQGRPEIGQWFEGRYNMPPMTYLHLVVQRRTAAKEFGFTFARALLRLREEAAYQRIRIPLTGAPEAVKTAGYIESRFDIVPPSDFEAIGYAPGGHAETFDPLEAGGLYTVTVMEREAVPFRVPRSKKLVTTSGRELRITKGGQRKIRLTPRSTE